MKSGGGQKRSSVCSLCEEGVGTLPIMRVN